MQRKSFLENWQLLASDLQKSVKNKLNSVLGLQISVVGITAWFSSVNCRRYNLPCRTFLGKVLGSCQVWNLAAMLCSYFFILVICQIIVILFYCLFVHLLPYFIYFVCVVGVTHVEVWLLLKKFIIFVVFLCSIFEFSTFAYFKHNSIEFAFSILFQAFKCVELVLWPMMW